MRKIHTGEKILHKMKSGDDAKAIAKRLTLEIFRMLGGDATATGFNRSLNYPASGIA